MKSVFLGRDLLIGSKVAAAADNLGVELQFVDAPSDLPPAEDVRLLFVDWAERSSDWGAVLTAWTAGARTGQPRIVLFGPHTDLESHRAARVHGIGPVMARSKFVTVLSDLLGPE
jgi:hypothetical protein